ncbi:MAG: LUD domain-containing protein [Taibaiella sp.]|nr:LUD domain-containing protein [Taibaiella sp.]
MLTLKTSKARENILAKIRKGLNEGTVAIPFPEVEKDTSPVFAKSDLSPEETFAEAFIQLGGKFVFCENEQELLGHIADLYESRQWKQLLCADKHLLQLFQNNKLDIAGDAACNDGTADACITGCEMLVARTGSAIISSNQYLGRTSTVFYPVHIIVAYAGQLVTDIDTALAGLKKRYGNTLPSMVNLNTGPSRTADIEKTLVVGVHGPGEVFCFYINA